MLSNIKKAALRAVFLMLFLWGCTLDKTWFCAIILAWQVSFFVAPEKQIYMLGGGCMKDHDLATKSRRVVDEVSRAARGMHILVILIFVSCIAFLVTWYIDYLL